MGRRAEVEGAETNRENGEDASRGSFGGMGERSKPMTAKAPDKRSVEFYATSPRIAQAYRSAARRNKRLSHLAEFKVFGSGGAIPSPVKHGREFATVVLSHADDDHWVFADAK